MKKNNSKTKEIIIELIPILIVLLLLCLFRNEIAITILTLLAIIFTFTIKYQKNEAYIFLFGLIIGIILELIGNFLLGQSWPDASFFSIPIWLPLTWGYGFIIIRRIGDIIIK